MLSVGHSPAILIAGRTKDLPVKLKERFIQFANMLGLTNDHVLYPVPTGNGQLGRGEGVMGTVQA
jgi:hypothetical protein